MELKWTSRRSEAQPETLQQAKEATFHKAIPVIDAMTCGQVDQTLDQSQRYPGPQHRVSDTVRNHAISFKLAANHSGYRKTRDFRQRPAGKIPVAGSQWRGIQANMLLYREWPLRIIVRRQNQARSRQRSSAVTVTDQQVFGLSVPIILFTPPVTIGRVFKPFFAAIDLKTQTIDLIQQFRGVRDQHFEAIIELVPSTQYFPLAGIAVVA